jgi:hypothetical protein
MADDFDSDAITGIPIGNGLDEFLLKFTSSCEALDISGDLDAVGRFKLLMRSNADGKMHRFAIPSLSNIHRCSRPRGGSAFDLANAYRPRNSFTVQYPISLAVY